MTRIVAALGGNALLRRDEPQEAHVQEFNVESACRAIAPLAADHQLVVTHGSGPQVGILAARAEAFPGSWHESLDVIGAETDGMIGYLLARELGNQLGDRPVATLLTQIEVALDDPAFDTPHKPIGPVLDPDRARTLQAERGWTMVAEDRGWRRIVASPEPRRIVEIESVRTLMRAGHVVVCAGGGGVPVHRDAGGTLHGVEAVVDKDLSASMLAIDLMADTLLLLTDTRCVYRDWPTCTDPIWELNPTEARRLDLPPGSMGPKVEAAARFVEQAHGQAAIGRVEDVTDILQGATGTWIRP